MKNIYLIYEPNTNAFGIETYINEFLKCFTNSPDYLIHVISIRSNHKKITIEKKEDNIRYIYIPNPVFPVNNIDYYYRDIIFALSGYIKEHNPVFFFQYKEQMRTFQYIKTLFPHSKTIFIVHYLNWPFLLNGNVESFKAIVNKEEDTHTPEEKNVYGKFKQEQQLLAQKEIDALVTLSYSTYDLLTNEYGIHRKKVFRIPNGLEDAFSTISAKEKKMLKKQYSIPEKEKVLLYVGRLEATKGIFDLLKSFESVIQKEKNVRLMIAGEGDFKTALTYSKQTGSKIIYTGRVDSDELSNLYRIADIGIIPSYHEQCSYVALEMMMHGLPLLVSDGIGLDEIFTDGQDAKKYSLEEKDQNPDYLANEIIDFIKQDKKDLQKKIREKYLNQYSTEVMKKKMINLFERLTRKEKLKQII